jgi:hypothetical protein
VTTTPLLAPVAASDTDAPPAGAAEQVEVIATSLAPHESTAVAVKTAATVPHCTVASAAVGHVITGAAELTTMVSAQVAWLSEASTPVQMTTKPLLEASAATDTVPSAFAVQPVAPAGHAQVTVHVLEHESLAVAETLMAGSPQFADAEEIAHVTAGGVVSTMATNSVQEAVMPHALVAVKVTSWLLLARTSAMAHEPSAF